MPNNAVAITWPRKHRTPEQLLGLSEYARNAGRHTRKKAAIQSAKTRPCMDCQGWYEPCQMQFDHRPGTDKQYEMAQAYRLSWRRIFAEIGKCDVVCANCHLLRTMRRLHAQ